MKDSIRILIIGSAVAALMGLSMYLPSNSMNPAQPLSPEEISWIEFCKARGYDRDTDDGEVVNEWLDTWVGSIEEEKVFNNLPALEV